MTYFSIVPFKIRRHRHVSHVINCLLKSWYDLNIVFYDCLVTGALHWHFNREEGEWGSCSRRARRHDLLKTGLVPQNSALGLTVFTTPVFIFPIIVTEFQGIHKSPYCQTRYVLNKEIQIYHILDKTTNCCLKFSASFNILCGRYIRLTWNTLTIQTSNALHFLDYLRKLIGRRCWLKFASRIFSSPRRLEVLTI